MKAKISRCFITLLITMTSSSGLAETYRWQDEDGIMHISEQPPANKPYEGGTITSYEDPAYLNNPLGAQGSGEVIMYSTQWCPYCQKARRYFKRNKIPFREYDVETTSKGRRDFKTLRARGVPVILIGHKRMNGFSEKSFEQLYKR
ncbi:glutaredoxin domain-containing protein [Pontibacterium sp.]|uniref:glutaredoxin domain-containing protein n=1 Tax=Pontibacterium sp. TaxID=2036026 RepID=UPI0035159DF5